MTILDVIRFFFRFEIDEQYSDALEELPVEKDHHKVALEKASSDQGSTVSEPSTQPNSEKKADTKEEKSEKKSEEPATMSPAAAAIVAEKEAVNKELKAKLAEIDDEIRRRKNAQDQLIRETKAAIDKEFDAVKEEARKAAAEKTGALDVKLGAVLNGSGNDGKNEL